MLLLESPEGRMETTHDHFISSESSSLNMDRIKFQEKNRAKDEDGD